MPFVLSIIGAIGAVIFVSLIFGVKGRVVIFNGILGGLGWMVYKLI
ncbi:MAG: threonine/serine exporter, partial [Acholeplasmataceae bacterium]|nr:threonine/serine exporter [Acholeplasmataceae bacterium]